VFVCPAPVGRANWGGAYPENLLAVMVFSKLVRFHPIYLTEYPRREILKKDIPYKDRLG
jgi:hypothetical protein